jgi:hypothetical protein
MRLHINLPQRATPSRVGFTTAMPPRPLFGSAFAKRLRMATPAISAVPVRKTDVRLTAIRDLAPASSEESGMRLGPEFVGLGRLLLGVDNGFHDGDAW